LIPPFKRKDASYTYRFEQHVVRLLIGSTEEEVARRLGISAETVARIVRQQVSAAKRVDPAQVISAVGMDEISLKKRHKLYVTILTDLTRPEQAEVLAVMPGRDEAAATQCLECLTAEQRAAVRSYRVDMAAAYNGVCARLLPNAAGVIDRFHVAKLVNDAIDGERKKNHPAAQGAAGACAAEGIPGADVAVPSRPQGLDGGGPRRVGAVVPATAAVAGAVRLAGTLQDDL
jgi:transposase